MSNYCTHGFVRDSEKIDFSSRCQTCTTLKIELLESRVSELENGKWEKITKPNTDVILLPKWYLEKLEATQDLIDNPEINDFIKGVKLEATHQIKRWGPDHDDLKTPEDWLWVIALLTTKATQAARYGDKDKYLHHIITCAAACLNWHKKARANEAR